LIGEVIEATGIVAAGAFAPHLIV